MKEYKCFGITVDEFKEIVELNSDLQIEDIEFDMGVPNISFKGDLDENFDKLYNVLKNYFQTKSVYLFASDSDQNFPYEIMIMLSEEKERDWCN